MWRDMNIFTKVTVLILFMLIPILILYTFSNKVSTHVVKSGLNKSSMDQSQVNANMSRLSLFPNILAQDPDVVGQQYMFLQNYPLDLDTITTIKRIQTKLNILSNSTNWRNHIYIYWPIARKVVSTDPSVTYKEYDKPFLPSRLQPGWSFQKNHQFDSQYDFEWFTVTPFSAISNPMDAKLIIEVKVSGDNIKDMLDEFKKRGGNDPFYFQKGQEPLYNRTANRTVIRDLVRQLEKKHLSNTDQRVMRVGDKEYLVNCVKSEEMEWYLVDYIPLEKIFHPIQKSNQLFYLSTAILLLMSCMAAYLLYIQVQVPIQELMRAFQSLRNENYSIRIQQKGTSEFRYLFEQFNLMAARLEELIERVYLKEIRLKEAKLKQLQSQINPHFFYNCFSFISSMAKLNKMNAVVAMAQNLSKYYRYTTRQERDFVSLEEEIQFVTNYLEIQAMRMNRLSYSIHVPNYMRKVNIPPLTLQPLVENAVIHGIEPTLSAGNIRITGEQYKNGYRLIVEDDGNGMPLEKMMRLQEKLNGPMDGEMGCGLWNVHQRLLLHYGSKSGIEITRSPLGGVRVIVKWGYKAYNSNEREEKRHD
jgi:two-component system sensor histidine kinase YesM